MNSTVIDGRAAPVALDPEEIQDPETPVREAPDPEQPPPGHTDPQTPEPDPAPGSDPFDPQRRDPEFEPPPELIPPSVPPGLRFGAPGSLR